MSKKKYAEALLRAKIEKKKPPKYELYGLTLNVADALKHYVDDLWVAVQNLQMQQEHDGNVIMEQFKIALHQKQNLSEAVILPTGLQAVVTHVVKPEVASYVFAGAALGLSAEIVYHFIEAIWDRAKNFYDGSHINKKEMVQYAAMVKRHVNKKVQVMIDDMRVALKHADYIKAARIQKEIKEYGERVGLHEDGAGAVASAVPTNNVGSGHIAGAAGDPPGPQAKLFKKPIKRKPVVGENIWVVSSDDFIEAKRKRSAYLSEILSFAEIDKDAPIILQDELTGAKCYLSYKGK